MRKIVLATLLLASALAGLAQTGAESVLADGSFEGAPAAEGLPPGWAHTFSTPETGYRISVAAGGRTGQRALLLEGAGEYGGATAGMVALSPGKLYAARGWVRLEGEAKSTGTVKLDYFDADRKHLLSVVPGLITGPTKEWQQISVMGRSAETARARFAAVTVALTGRGRAWFDDLAMLVREDPSPGNLAANGGGETFAGTRVAGYYVGTSPGGRAVLEPDPEQPKEGAFSLRMKGDAEWAVAVGERVRREKGKVYTLAGFARARSGSAQLKIDFFKGEQHLGQVEADLTTSREWQAQKVTALVSDFPDATHVAAVGVGLGNMDVSFDGMVLTGK